MQPGSTRRDPCCSHRYRSGECRRPRDPVARFHLRNGAVLRDVLVGADGSMHGLHQSLGILASYAYPLDGQPQPDLPDPIDPTEAEEDLFRALLSSRGAA